MPDKMSSVQSIFNFVIFSAGWEDSNRHNSPTIQQAVSQVQQAYLPGQSKPNDVSKFVQQIDETVGFLQRTSAWPCRWFSMMPATFPFQFLPAMVSLCFLCFMPMVFGGGRHRPAPARLHRSRCIFCAKFAANAAGGIRTHNLSLACLLFYHCTTLSLVFRFRYLSSYIILNRE